ncbi:nucleotidyltransferase domain-containing protein [candidate division KSB1 bacterium]|nr:nucleotidyltransferase domain-containing protein [candidate division KSB1 bacterium]
MEYSTGVQRNLGSRLKKLYLFGSRARGDAWEGSDYDFALVVDKRDSELDNTILDISVMLLDQYEVLISTQVFTEYEWKLEHKFPLGINILNEGISFL